MKTLRFLILGWLAMTGIGRAQTTTNIAEVITPEIQALADGLQRDPVQIFNYVHDHIQHVLYFGSKKGAQLTLLERSGNDFDQSALLVAMLRAAGHTNAGYQFGWMLMPYDNPDGSHRDLHHWLGLNLTNSNWAYTANYLDVLLRGWRFYPLTRFGWDTNTFAFQRVWVTLAIGGTNYYLDPAFKVSEPLAGTNVFSALGFSGSAALSNALMTAAQGVVTGNYVTNLNESALQNLLTGYTTNFLNYLQSNCPNASVAQILGGPSIVPSTNTALPQTLLFPSTNMNGTMPVTNWVNIPTNMMSTLTISFAGMNKFWFMPQLQGERLSLTISSSGAAQLWQDDKSLASGSKGGGGGASSLTLKAYHPGWHGSWDTTNNVFIPASPSDPVQHSFTASYKNASANYAILYSFEPDWGWLQQRQKQLDSYQEQGLSDTSRQVVTETLNIMGLNWQLQAETVGRLLAQQIGALPQSAHRLGRMAQESGQGYYVDIYASATATASNGGSDGGPGYDPYALKWIDLASYFGSAMEHGMIEQLQSSNLLAASTVKMLQWANTNHQAVYLTSSTNWATVQTQLVNYTISDLTAIINAGYTLLLPKNGSNRLAGASGWAGFGFLVRSDSGGVQMLIGPGIFGGYALNLGAIVSPRYINYSSYVQPSYFSLAPPSLPAITGADPVNLADGTFQADSTDLALGEKEPRGLSLSRYYSSGRRDSNLAGLAHGWLHNYFLNAAAISAPQSGLGGTTPAQMAPMLMATTAAVGLYNGAQPNPKNWLTTALIAKWGIDQLTGKAVSVTLGKDTVQFIQQPDGRYTPPANCTLTLTENGAGYNLQERHGRTFQFNAAGWATNIVDQYNQSLTLTYNASNWVKTATDWQGRTLTFNYSNTPSRLAVVTDGSRSVKFGYSSGGDLISAIDPENKTNKFLYDTNHQITATINALGQTVASNLYNGFGRVVTQYTQGDLTKLWKIYWSGWRTVEQDPAGSQRTFIYDDQTRLVALRDALGNTSRTIYDGQDHVVMTVSPLNETNQSVYDANHNLLATIDPLGFSNQFFYDSQHKLVRVEDARGNASTFGYNAQFSLTGSTNGAGDWTTSTYNADGTLATTVDAGGTTTYGYDVNGQLNSLTYPGSLGSEGFLNSTAGDVLSRTNARGFVTSFQYNLRRQLTNTLAPTNVTASASYDAVGNQQTSKDARGFSVTNTWSATQKLLATTLPQGSVITNVYDARDWLVKTLDPLQHATLVTNDAAQRLVSVTDALSRTTRFGYDVNGHPLSTTNAANEVTRQQWNARGELVKSTDGAGHTVLSAFDAAGNQIILTNRNGKKWQFQFDAANRLTNTITPLGRTTTLTFDNRGLLKTLREPSGQMTTNNFDAKGRLTNSVDGVASTLYQYDANDNVTSVTNAGQASRLSQSFDAYDRMTSHTNADGHVIQYRYDANGNLTNLIYPGGKTVTYFYDSLNRLTNVTDWSGRKTVMTYDLASQLKSLTRPNGTTRTIDYDAAGQTTNILEKTALGYPIALFRFNWNVNATMQWEFAAPLPHTNTPPTRTMTFDEDNRLATFNGAAVTVDADGNLTTGPLTNTAFATYTYDARNRLTSAGGLSYAYDPSGNRTAVTNGANVTKLVVNPNASLSQVLVRIKGGVTNYYVYGAGLLYEVTETATATNTLTYHYDYRGSTVALTDGNGTVTDRIEYSAYATTTYRTGTNDIPFLFNGRYGVQTDLNGLLHMRARYYNPLLCRFLNADPSGFSGGLNFYAYANGNPISLIDPFGLGAVGESGAASWLRGSTLNYASVGQDYAAQQATFHDAMNQPPLWAIEAKNVASSNRGQPSYGTLALLAATIFQPALAPRTLPELGAANTVGTRAMWAGQEDGLAAALNSGARVLAPSQAAVDAMALGDASLMRAESAAWARGATGEVPVFFGNGAGQIFLQDELPELLRNMNSGKVTGINIHF